MRVLFLTCHLPYPLVSGGRLREHELLRRLPGVEVHLVAVTKTYGEDAANAPFLEGTCASVTVFPAEATPPPSRLPAQVGRHRSAAAAEHVARLLRDGRVDLVHAEGFYLDHLVPRPCPRPKLLVEQNVEFRIWEQRAAVARGRREREAHGREAATTRSAEVAAWRSADRLAAVTEDDRSAMLAVAPGLEVRVVPDGAPARSPALPRRPAQVAGPLAVFVANFAYQPNADAAVHLCRDVWPSVLERVPGAGLYLVGNAPPPEVTRLARRARSVTVTGRVPSVEPYLAAADVVACPLRLGGGVKVKVLESLARGKATVTTSVGAQGLAAAASALVVADAPAHFAAAVADLLSDPARRAILEARARAVGASLPTWDDAAAALRDCYEELASAAAAR